MDGVSWGTTRAPESFSRSRTAADTLSRLASFIARADIKQHPQNKRPPPDQLSTYVCQECGKSFPHETELLHHQELKHALPKPHRCLSCGQEFSLRSSLQLHKCNHEVSPCELCHGESQLGSPCPVCTTHTSDPSRLQDKSPHRQPQLLDGSPYACAPCGRGFSQKQALLHHQQTGCSEPPSTSDLVDASSLPDDSPPVSDGDSTCSDSSDTPGPSSRAVNVCQFCLKMFRTEAGLQRHKQTNHAEERLMAPQGQKTKGRKRGNAKLPKSNQKILNCRSCDMVFMSTSQLYVHRKEKHSRDKNMSKPRAVSTRRRVITYPCQVCGKVLVHHLQLRAHYRQHPASSFTTIENKTQPVVCTTKDSELSENRPNTLKTSIAENKTVKAGRGRPRKVAKLENKVTDPGRRTEVPEKEELEREFPCPSCAEVFSLQSQLREHVELHQSSLKRRPCSVCTNEMDTCKWPGSKRQRLYHCVPCQQGFSALDSFLEHCQEHLRVRVEEDCITEGCTHWASKA
ncbi:oocyte zinc finger protein XlCOF22 [Cottoperca gobio]|uniref:Oocyte zinc finger protein XlCOF22-like n=1 Tax=Cottoperca gobio TaxID=56716 RepID=A0A6J2Q3N9_COTGO|nr:oocyte zinc finger protein XlCOF22-like [Cottoperca gobio]XP_029292255.1 oocyte zinc finger protein XlCOF22-like [Cottoperca gobio]